MKSVGRRIGSDGGIGRDVGEADAVPCRFLYGELSLADEPRGEPVQR
jgi:hypothetical protein